MCACARCVWGGERGGVRGRSEGGGSRTDAAETSEKLIVDSSHSLLSARPHALLSLGGDGLHGPTPHPNARLARRMLLRRLATMITPRPPPPPSAASSVVILYHCPCNDGAYAALAAHLHFGREGGAARPRYVPHHVTTPLSLDALALNATDTVYLLDYVGPTGFAAAVAGRVARCVVLDHHKTARDALPPKSEWPPTLEATLDMDRSGAGIARDYFDPPLTPSQASAFASVQDGDLWTWALPQSRAFYAGLAAAALPFDGGPVTTFDALAGLDFEATVAVGETRLAGQDAAVHALADSAFVVALGGRPPNSPHPPPLSHTCLAVHVTTDQAGLRSALGNELAARSAAQGRRAVGAVAYRERDMNGSPCIKVSLRSIGEEEDTTVVSCAHGGGGHLNASSFIIDEGVWREWRVAEK